jgi:hypothetical protein
MTTQTRRSRRRWDSSKRPEPPTPSPTNEAPSSYTTSRDLTAIAGTPFQPDKTPVQRRIELLWQAVATGMFRHLRYPLGTRSRTAAAHDLQGSIRRGRDAPMDDITAEVEFVARSIYASPGKLRHPPGRRFRSC